MSMYGVALDREDVLDMVDVNIKNGNDLHFIDLYIAINNKLKTKLTFALIPKDGIFYLGCEMSKMKNDYTLHVFKLLALVEIKRLTRRGFKQKIAKRFGYICHAYEC